MRAQTRSDTGITNKISALAEGRVEEIPIRRKHAYAVENALSDYIIHQLSANPSMTQCELQTRLRALFGSDPKLECQGSEQDLIDSPRVFANAQAAPRQVVVIYNLWLGCMGEGCTVPVFESYSCGRGIARRTIRLDTMLSGYSTHPELLAWFPDKEQYWVLLSAIMTGASGRVLPYQAFLVQIGTDSVKILWKTQVVGNLEIHTHRSDLGWEIGYVDNSLYPNGPDKQVLDVYRLDYNSQTFRRIIHYHDK